MLRRRGRWGGLGAVRAPEEALVECDEGSGGGDPELIGEQPPEIVVDLERLRETQRPERLGVLPTATGLLPPGPCCSRQEKLRPPIQGAFGPRCFHSRSLGG